jgi:hypothetical protein
MQIIVQVIQQEIYNHVSNVKLIRSKPSDWWERNKIVYYLNMQHCKNALILILGILKLMEF